MDKISTKSNKQNIPPATSTRTLRPRKSSVSVSMSASTSVQRFAPYPSRKIKFVFNGKRDSDTAPAPLQVDSVNMNYDLDAVDHATPTPAYPGWPRLRFESPSPALELDVREPGPEGATEMERVLPSIAMILAS